MRVVVSLFALFIVLLGSYLVRIQGRNQGGSGSPETRVLSSVYLEEKDVSGKKKDTDKETQTNQATVSTKPSNVVITPSATPSPFITRSETINLLDKYVYPNNFTIKRTSGSLAMESTDTPNSITDWYKEKMRKERLSITSFVTTINNGNVLNKLVGNEENLSVSVSITKDAGQNITTIVVTIFD